MAPLLGVLYALVGISLVEMVAVDMIVRVHHPQAANVLLVLGLLTAVWLLGFARAVQMRPTLVTPSGLDIRMGLLWSIEVPRSAISSIDYGRLKAPARGAPAYLRLSPQPNVLVTLREPLTAWGMYGSSRSVSQIGLTVDDVEGFQTLTRS